MTDSINTGTFIQHLTYLIRLGVYINKGTDRDDILKRCCALHNRYKKIETSKDITAEDITSIRRCLKRINLTLKVTVDDDGDEQPVVISNKENQRRMPFLTPHSSLESNDLSSMIKYATLHNIMILSEIPLMFILRKSPHQNLMWQYVRTLFYITQILVCQDIDGCDDIIDASLDMMGEALIAIDKIQTSCKVNAQMSADRFLGNMLINTNLNESNVSQASDEVKEIFRKRGHGGNETVTNLIDEISGQLQGIDVSQGNLIQNMFSIAGNVVNNMQGQLEKDPNSIQSILGSITDVFKDSFENSDGKEQVPPEIRDMFQQVLEVTPGVVDTCGNQGSTNSTNSMNPTYPADPADPTDQEAASREMLERLNRIASIGGVDLGMDQLNLAVRGENGEIDPSKMESFLSNLKPQ